MDEYMDEFDDVEEGIPSYYSQQHVKDARERAALEKRIRHYEEREANINLILHYLPELKKTNKNPYFFIFEKKVDRSQLSNFTDTELGNFADDFVLLMKNTKHLTQFETEHTPVIKRLHLMLKQHLKGGSRRKSRLKFHFLSPKSLRKHRAFYRTKKVRRAAKRADQALADMKKLI